MTLKKIMSHKVKLPITKKGVAIPTAILMITLCCSTCFAYYFIDTSLREMGFLPTYTPSPPPTLTSTITPTSKLSNTPTTMPSKSPESSSTPPPTETSIPPTETTTPIVGPKVIIQYVNKQDEYVDLKNIGGEAQNLSGWILVSEKGEQRCPLAGTINPGETLRVWTNNAIDEGFNCNIGTNIWNNSESDPASLLNNMHELISSYP